MHHSLVKDTIIECHNVMVYSHKRTDTVRMEDGHQQEDEHSQGGWTTVVRLDTGREDRRTLDGHRTDGHRTDGHWTDTVWEWGCARRTPDTHCVGVGVCFWLCGFAGVFCLCGCAGVFLAVWVCGCDLCKVG